MISSVLVEAEGKVDHFKSEVFDLGEVEEGKVGHFRSEVSHFWEGRSWSSKIPVHV